MHFQESESPSETLTPAVLVRDYGIRSLTAKRVVGVLYRWLSSQKPEAMERWLRTFGDMNSREMQRFAEYAPVLARRYGIQAEALQPGTLWFGLQSYYAAMVLLLARRFVAWDIDDFPGGDLYRWCFSCESEEVIQQIAALRTLVDRHSISACDWDHREDGDWFKPLYQDLFPRQLRHRLGEYYTPGWLAGYVLDRIGFEGKPGERLLDPACGSGTFLMMALRRVRKSALPLQKDSSKDTSCDSVFSWFTAPAVVGCDINPLAVLTARANYVMAMADCLPKNRPVEIPVYLVDSILERPPHLPFSEPFQFVVGNPPWIAWDHLSEDYRRASRPLWQQYGLFSLSGNEARHGGGKKDLSMLMLYVSADRYLKKGGRLGMVITQTLFQTKGAGDGFRRFQLGPQGEPIKVFQVDDLVAVRPFDAANWTSVIFLEKGQSTIYPVPYIQWTFDKTVERKRRLLDGGNSHSPVAPSHFEAIAIKPTDGFLRHPCWALPMDPDHPSSPWLIQSERAHGQETSHRTPIHNGPSDYQAHLGANSGGANGVYWLEILGFADGGVLVRNMAAKGKRGLKTVEQVIEPDLLYPLLRWSDVKRYSASASSHILLVQDVFTRTGIEEKVMRDRYPRALLYLEQFREFLTTRAAYRRYQHAGPFYSMYNVGEYTVSPIKVVWRRMDRRINAAVLEPVQDPWLGSRPVVPQETCVLVACNSLDEAHYLCALLNSDPVNDQVAARSVQNGKGFGTPSILEYLGLARFCSDNPEHQKLAAQSRAMHDVWKGKLPPL